MKQRLRIQLVLVFSLLLMIPVVSFAQSKSSAVSQPAPYPNLKSTGNPEADIKQHQKEVQKWQQKEQQRNSSLQKNSNTTSKPSSVSNKRIEEKKKGLAPVEKKQKTSAGQREITVLNLPGYPKFIATGNPELDEKNYQLAKAKWIDENPELYQKHLKEGQMKKGILKRPNTTNR
jgi:hypothetical protein